MKEIHAGLCGSHIGSRSLLGKVFRQGFYWPKAALGAAELVQKCEGCQKCARDQKQPSSLTQLIQPTWPLQRWGLDLLGPLPPAQGNLRYVVVAVEYFSKWIEAKPLATITSVTIQKFFWQNHNDMNNEVNLQSAQGKVARRINQSGVEPQHNNIKINRLYAIQTVVW
jgi:hypothetical protein